MEDSDRARAGEWCGWSAVGARGVAKRDLQLPARHSTRPRRARELRSMIGVDGFEWTGIVGRTRRADLEWLVEALEGWLIARNGAAGFRRREKALKLYRKSRAR